MLIEFLVRLLSKPKFLRNAKNKKIRECKGKGIKGEKIDSVTKVNQIAKFKEVWNIDDWFNFVCSNLKVALEVVKSETLHTHNPHDRFRSGLYKQITHSK